MPPSQPFQPRQRSVAELRRDYAQAALSEQDAADEPLQQFRQWFEQACEADLPEPNAMTLATADANGRPSARIVLLKGFDERGFTFYTNYRSQKGRQLEANPWAALVFWWAELERQVRIEGRVGKTSASESDAYFQSRPYDSQLGAWASQQSEPLTSRRTLEQAYRQLQAQYAQGPVPRPTFWGGFRLSPDTLEFWQGRASRLHDRIRYRWTAPGDWIKERLAP